MERSGILAALQAHDLSLAEYRRARASDPVFNAAAVDLVDSMVSYQAAEALKAQAATGDMKAIRALTDGTLDRLAGDSESIDGDDVVRVTAWPTCPCCDQRFYALAYLNRGLGARLEVFRVDDPMRPWEAVGDVPPARPHNAPKDE